MGPQMVQQRPAKGEILEILCNRVAVASADEPARFTDDDARDWGDNALRELTQARLLQEAPCAPQIECRGCSQRCFRPVDRLPSLGTVRARYFTTCELRDDISVVPVDPRRVRRWCSSRSMVASFAAHGLGLRIKDTDCATGRIRFSAGQIGKRRLSVCMEFTETAILLIGGLPFELADQIDWQQERPRMNVVNIEHMTPETLFSQQGSNRHQHSRLKQRLRAQESKERDRLWQDMADALKAEDQKLKKEHIAHAIFEGGKWRGVGSAATIARRIRVPRK